MRLPRPAIERGKRVVLETGRIVDEADGRAKLRGASLDQRLKRVQAIEIGGERGSRSTLAFDFRHEAGGVGR